MGGHPGQSPEEGLTSVASRDTELAWDTITVTGKEQGIRVVDVVMHTLAANKFQRLIVHGYANQPGYIDRGLLLTTAYSSAAAVCLRRANGQPAEAHKPKGSSHSDSYT